MSLIHNVFDTDKHFSINVSTRELTNQTPEKTQLMQGDHNSERISFNMPRYVEGHDMTLCNVIQVHYTNIDTKTKEEVPGLYDVIDVQTSPEDENTAIFTWLVSANATGLVGSLQFRITFKCVKDGIDVYRWNTEICKELKVSKGITNSECFDEDCADFVSGWEERIKKLEAKETQTFVAVYGSTTFKAIGDAANAGMICVASRSNAYLAVLVNNNADVKKFFRYDSLNYLVEIYQVDTASNWTRETHRFVRSVDGKYAGSDGNAVLNAVSYSVQKPTEAQQKQARENLGITGDGGNGKDGVSPEISVSAIAGGNRISIKDINGVQHVDVMDGKNGADGKDGYTPKKGVDYFDGTDGRDGNPGKDGTSVTHSWNGTVLTINSASGTSRADLKGEQGEPGEDGYTPQKGVDYFDGKDGQPGKDGNDGQPGKDGTNGKDGVSPTVTVSKSGKVTTVTITDASGTKTATINDGADGAKGETGATGPQGPKGDTGEKGDPGAIETPKIVSSVDEMTDTSKHYVLDGYIWHNKTVVTEGSTTITHPNLFVPGTAELNKRYSLSSGSLSSSNGYFMTDYIELVDFGNTTPYNANLNWECPVESATDAKFILFNSNKEKIGASFIKTTYNNITVANGKSVIDLKTINTSGGGSQPTASEVAYVRFQLPVNSTLSTLTSADIAGLEITFDAITKTETTEGTITQEWVNSGISYAPTFKTDLIGVLGENNVIYLSDNLPSGTYTLKYPDNDYETLGTFTK